MLLPSDTPEEGVRSHYGWLWAIMWLLGFELRIFRGAVGALTSWAISPALSFVFSWIFLKIGASRVRGCTGLCMPSILALGRQRQRVSEFETSLVYRVNFRTARATQRNSFTKKKKKKKDLKKIKINEFKGRHEYVLHWLNEKRLLLWWLFVDCLSLVFLPFSSFFSKTGSHYVTLAVLELTV